MRAPARDLLPDLVALCESRSRASAEISRARRPAHDHDRDATTAVDPPSRSRSRPSTTPRRLAGRSPCIARSASTRNRHGVTSGGTVPALLSEAATPTSSARRESGCAFTHAPRRAPAAAARARRRRARAVARQARSSRLGARLPPPGRSPARRSPPDAVREARGLPRSAAGRSRLPPGTRRGAPGAASWKRRPTAAALGFDAGSGLASAVIVTRRHRGRAASKGTLRSRTDAPRRRPPASDAGPPREPCSAPSWARRTRRPSARNPRCRVDAMGSSGAR
jgi:hypothetical protein